eukprot:jgi/Bigna1/87598/estExt_fgenesh1_pg.C_220066
MAKKPEPVKQYGPSMASAVEESKSSMRLTNADTEIFEASERSRQKEALGEVSLNHSLRSEQIMLANDVKTPTGIKNHSNDNSPSKTALNATQSEPKTFGPRKPSGGSLSDSPKVAGKRRAVRESRNSGHPSSGAIGIASTTGSTGLRKSRGSFGSELESQRSTKVYTPREGRSIDYGKKIYFEEFEVRPLSKTERIRLAGYGRDFLELLLCSSLTAHEKHPFKLPYRTVVFVNTTSFIFFLAAAAEFFEINVLLKTIVVAVVGIVYQEFQRLLLEAGCCQNRVARAMMKGFGKLIVSIFLLATLVFFAAGAYYVYEFGALEFLFVWLFGFGISLLILDPMKLLLRKMISFQSEREAFANRWKSWFKHGLPVSITQVAAALPQTSDLFKHHLRLKTNENSLGCLARSCCCIGYARKYRGYRLGDSKKLILSDLLNNDAQIQHLLDHDYRDVDNFNFVAALDEEDDEIWALEPVHASAAPVDDSP